MRWISRLVVLAATSACSQAALVEAPVPVVPSVVHLDLALDGAVVEAPARPSGVQERVWRFSEPRPEWRVVSGAEVPRLATVAVEPRADGVRVALGRPPAQRGPLLVAAFVVDLDGLRFADWESVVVEARSSERMAGVHVVANVGDENLPDDRAFFGARDDAPPMFSDGSTQRYAIPLRGPSADEPLRNVGVFFAAPAPAAFDLLSIALVPRGAAFPDAHGVESVQRGEVTRTTLYAHTPAKLTWHVAAPPGARLDTALAALPGERVTYRVVVGDETLATFEVAGEDGWQQRTVDLSSVAGRTVDLTLEAEGTAPGDVALWGAPVLSGEVTAPEKPPNVVFYVIDGAGAETMSVYGYNRPTTPFLARLAEEGVVFERAYSNATWTQPSTASFMTSLQHSVLGGLRRGMHSSPIPTAATTMAEHMRRGGYLTASFTANPNAGRVIGVERGTDVQSDAKTEDHATSSPVLHERFWQWRQDYPAEPFWVHFQTTDVHEPNESVPPYAGLYASPERRARAEPWDEALFQAGGRFFGTTSIARFYEKALAAAEIDRRAYYSLRRDMYDETMAYQDHQLSVFVAELKAAGLWDHTILVVASDHGHPAGTFARWGRGLLEPQPEPWQGGLFDAWASHVPLLVVWPGHLSGGRRVADPVSMIDVMPTVLDLAGLPPAEVAQGRSLGPLLRGEALPPRPVVLDEFRVDEATGEMIGNLEVIDGRWGASLEIGPGPDGQPATVGRHDVPAGGRWGAVHPFTPEVARLQLYDLWRDPYATKAVNDRHPELVATYTALLEELWGANQALAVRFTHAEAGEVTPEQLHQLEALGYVR